MSDGNDLPHRAFVAPRWMKAGGADPALDGLTIAGREEDPAMVVIVNPDPETRSAYLKLEREFSHLRDELAVNRDHPAATSDGVALELLANINSSSDTGTACKMGASGIGLFRTEYLYLTHPSVPSEESARLRDRRGPRPEPPTPRGPPR